MRFEKWSGRRDSNSRPLAPHASALPGCATSRTQVKYCFLKFLTCHLILLLYTAHVKRSQDEQKGPWQKTPYANLIRYVPSRTYFARIRIQGKLIVKSLKTDSIAVAKLGLGDLEKDELQNAEHRAAASAGKMTFGDCLKRHSNRRQADPTFKPKTK